jgi:WhiB family redox-sensing transcriptional regulator
MWERAKCREHNGDLDDFYPDRDIDSYTPAANRAKAVCRGEDGKPVCPVLLECLALALLTGDGFGIWGGLSPRERNALRRSKDLSKYKAVQKLPPNPYREMIQEYLNGIPEGVSQLPERDQQEQDVDG